MQEDNRALNQRQSQVKAPRICLYPCNKDRATLWFFWRNRHKEESSAGAF